MNYNEGQLAAIEGITETFLARKPKIKVLSGGAGTGKTACSKQVLENIGEDANIAVTATTNKAAKVLREMTGREARTIYSLLGLQLLPSGEIKELKQREHGTLPIEEVDGAFIDEGSMTNRRLKALVDEASLRFRIPIVYIADECQLPPVGEEISQIFEHDPDYHLTQVMRFDNQILKLATALRAYTKFPIGNLPLVSDNDEVEGVWRKSVKGMLMEACERAEAGDFQSGKCKVIAWRNAEVDRLNKELRAAIGTQDLLLPYSKGDRIIARSPCMTKDKASHSLKTLLHTDDECLVVATHIAKHPYYPEYECFITDLETEDDDIVSVWTVTPQSNIFLQQELQRLAEDARKNPRNWKYFWTLKEAFHDIALAYAITSHRSQGSTYEHAFVNFADILSNPNRVEAAKSLYVSCSRPSKRLTLGG